MVQLEEVEDEDLQPQGNAYNDDDDFTDTGTPLS